MRTRLTSLFLLFWLFYGINSNAQTGQIKFAVEVDNGYFEILLNDTLLLKKYKDTLPVGFYEATVWSPSYLPKDFKFEINEGDNKSLYLKLDRNPDYIDFVRKDVEWDKKRNRLARLPVGLTVTSGIFTIVSHQFLAHQHRKLNENLAEYRAANGVFQLQLYKENFAPIEKNYNRLRTAFYSGVTVTSALAVMTVFTRWHFHKHYKYNVPSYQDHSPWHDRFTWHIGPQSVHLTYSL